MAKKFLYLVAVIIVLIIVAMIALRVWSKELTELAFVPTSEFVDQAPLDDNAFQDPALWYSRPGMGTSDPARWQPAMRGEGRTIPTPADQSPADFAVFFVHPTSFIDRTRWNAPFDEPEAERIAKLYIRGMASPFNQAEELWVPRYRQATMGAFLTDSAEAQQALNAAYQDVLQSFEFFLASADADSPIILVGHSQGSLHLLRLLRERIANDAPVAGRLAAVYAIGWPISVDHDLPALGIPACTSLDQSGCILSWSSYAEPADPSDVIETYGQSIGFDGTQRGESTIVCTNPITGTLNASAGADKNLGTLVPEGDLYNGELVPNSVPARCDERGLLLIGDPPEMGSYVLPGNNYHVYDIPLFWRNTQQDVAMRVDAWHKAN
ncbi:MAG: DUF3089 domain-containing protein [Erythrobacter sp.]